MTCCDKKIWLCDKISVDMLWITDTHLDEPSRGNGPAVGWRILKSKEELDNASILASRGIILGTNSCAVICAYKRFIDGDELFTIFALALYLLIKAAFGKSLSLFSICHLFKISRNDSVSG